MKHFAWSPEKNQQLRGQRGISFVFLETIIPSRKATRQYLGDQR